MVVQTRLSWCSHPVTMPWQAPPLVTKVAGGKSDMLFSEAQKPTNSNECGLGDQTAEQCTNEKYVLSNEICWCSGDKGSVNESGCSSDGSGDIRSTR